MAEVGQRTVMDADEIAIVEFLKPFGENWVGAREICRKADGKRRFAEDNEWAKPALLRLRDSRVLENDMLGRYRIMPPKKEKERWISPEAQKTLLESGVQVDADRADAAADEV